MVAKEFKGLDTIEDNAIMSTSYDGMIGFSPKFFGDNVLALLREIYAPGHVKNLTVKGIGIHEASHLLVKCLINYNDFSPELRKMLLKSNWDFNIETNRLIYKAKNRLKTNKSLKELKQEVSYYATKNNSECFAECISDYLTNGKKASDLSKSLWEVVNKELSIK